MTYLALARKYRPKNFDQMAGQSAVLKTLRHAILQNHCHHAYLFTGTRGVGKTSLARIFAKCLNCESKKNITVSPCNQCSSCLQIDQGRYLDVIEIDAASRTKVEDTRDLLDSVQYKPQQGRYKIYIIDEVHMLSGHSFNALLKTLEEPPSHVKFLLATTDPQKLPVTVLSRCLQLHLKNISIEQISAQLTWVLDKEKLVYEKSALSLIAQNAQGSMRDALSLLDQAISHGNGKICESEVSHLLGCVSEEKISYLLDLLNAQDTENLLTLIDQWEEDGVDFFVVLDSFLSLLQKISLSQFTSSALSSATSSPLAMTVKKFTPETIQLYYQIALLGKRDLPLAPDLKSGFIMIALRLMFFSPHIEQSELKPELELELAPESKLKLKPEPELKTKTLDQSEKLEHPQALTLTPILNVPQEDLSAVLPSPYSRVKKPVIKKNITHLNWAEIIPTLQLTGAANVLASNCSVSSYDLRKAKIDLVLDPQNIAYFTDSTKERLTKALSDYCKKPCQVNISIAKSTTETPFQQKTRESQQKIKSVENILLADEKIQSLMSIFSAELISENHQP